MLLSVLFASVCNAVLVKQAGFLLDCSITEEQLVMQEKMLAIPVQATPALNCLPINQHSIKKSCPVGVSISEIADNSAVIGKVHVLMPTLWPNAIWIVMFWLCMFPEVPHLMTCTFSYQLLLFPTTDFSYLSLHTVTFYTWIVFPFVQVPQSFQDRGKLEIFNENFKKIFKKGVWSVLQQRVRKNIVHIRLLPRHTGNIGRKKKQSNKWQTMPANYSLQKSQTVKFKLTLLPLF